MEETMNVVEETVKDAVGTAVETCAEVVKDSVTALPATIREAKSDFNVTKGVAIGGIAIVGAYLAYKGVKWIWKKGKKKYATPSKDNAQDEEPIDGEYDEFAGDEEDIPEVNPEK